jgi:hypothetical protein
MEQLRRAEEPEGQQQRANQVERKADHGQHQRGGTIARLRLRASAGLSGTAATSGTGSARVSRSAALAPRLLHRVALVRPWISATALLPFKAALSSEFSETSAVRPKTKRRNLT